MLRCRHLSAQLLRPKPEQVTADGAVQWIEAPDPAHEVGAVLRRVKRLLLDGCAPDDILIALRDWPLYGGQVAAQGAMYGLPLALHYGEAAGAQSGNRGAARPAGPAQRAIFGGATCSTCCVRRILPCRGWTARG